MKKTSIKWSRFFQIALEGMKILIREILTIQNFFDAKDNIQETSINEDWHDICVHKA